MDPHNHDHPFLVRGLQAGAGTGAPGSVSGLTLAEAEGLLDWLENHGCTKLEVSIGSESVTVRCLCPPGFQRSLEE